MSSTTQVKMATDKQDKFFRKLQEERGLPVTGFAPGTSAKDASAAIDAMLALPKGPAQVTGPQAAVGATELVISVDEAKTLLAWAGVVALEVDMDGADMDMEARLRSFIDAQNKPAPVITKAAGTVAAPAVPEGRYAVTGNDGTTDFYVVEIPTAGKWAGFVFLSQQISDDYVAVKNPKTKATILAKIAQDPKAASIRYGQELGKCGVCNKTLTDNESIAAGIGPVCAKNMGW
jgi:hypothetical protein